MTLQELRKPKITVKKKTRKKKVSQQTLLERLPQADKALPSLEEPLPIQNRPLLPSEALLENDTEPTVNEAESLQTDELIEENRVENAESANSALTPEAAASVSSKGKLSPQPEHVFASWNRKLHSKRNLQDIPIRTEPIPTPHLKVLRAIFKDSSKITYRSFESLWLQLNGEKSIKPSKKNGTSHRRLLNSDGQVVGGTFALNGGKRQYSDKPLKELRDALTLIGYGQSYLSLF